MAGKLVTIATFDQPPKARLAQNALEAAGIKSTVADENTVAMDWLIGNAIGWVKVQVLEEDAERAVAVLDETFGKEEPVDEAALAAEAEAAAPEEGVEPTPAPKPTPEPTPEPPKPDTDTPLSERDWYARGLFFIGWLGLGFPPAAFVALYFFLNAAFGAGTLSPRGRFNLIVSGVVTAFGVCIAGTICAGLGGAFR